MSRADSFSAKGMCVAVAAVFVTGLLHLGVRLKEIQMDDAADYGYASAKQSVRRIAVGGPRGCILDRHGDVLVGNKISVSIVCYPEHFQRRTWKETSDAIGDAIDKLAMALGKSSPLSERAIRRHVDQSLAIPLRVWHDIGPDDLAVFSEREREFPGFGTFETEERDYRHGAVAAHVLGYVGRDRGETNAGDERFHYSLFELRGRAGLEAYYDSYLRGVPGERKVLVDARGFAIREWTVVEPQEGPNLRLTIDLGLQRVVERELRGVCGACAVIDPRTGEVLALASAPGFDPNSFVPVLRQEVYDGYVNDPRKPLLNRASGGGYAPGSTFKPITALAGLAAGYPQSRTYSCVGAFRLGEMVLHCTRQWGHGELDLKQALMRSCNPFFCDLAADIGTNALICAAQAFGLGRKTGLDLGVDSAGTVPDADWKQRTYHERWFAGDLVQMAIGQGMLLVSPLQMALVAGAIGTGRLVTPHLKLDLSSEERALPFTDEQLAIVREGLRMVVVGDGESRGTGWRGGERVKTSVSGKTGTAEIGRGATRRKNTWFMAYAPSDCPTVAIAMVVENGDTGGGTTAPKVRNVLAYLFGETEATQ